MENLKNCPLTPVLRFDKAFSFMNYLKIHNRRGTVKKSVKPVYQNFP